MRNKKAVALRNNRLCISREKLYPVAVYLLRQNEGSVRSEISGKIAGDARVPHIAPRAQGYPKLYTHIPQGQTGDTSVIESPIFI